MDLAVRLQGSIETLHTCCTLLDLPLLLYDLSTTSSRGGVAEEFSRLEGPRGEVERVEWSEGLHWVSLGPEQRSDKRVGAGSLRQGRALVENISGRHVDET